jgi:tetratricopeptide (TPR) repeat protein
MIVCIAPAICGCQKIVEQRKHYYYNKGMQFFNNKNYIAAAKEFENVLEFDKKNFDALYMHGMAYYAMGDFTAALSSFQKASIERPEDVKLKLKIADCFLNVMDMRKKGSFARLLSYFDSEIKPLIDKNRNASYLLLKYYIKQNKLIEAEQLIKNLSGEEKQDACFYVLLMEFKLKKDQIFEASEIVLQHYSNIPEWESAIGFIIDKLQQSGYFQQIESIYKKIVEKTDNKLPYQQALAKIYRKRDAGKEEEELLLSMLKDNPEKLEIKRQYIDFLKYYNRITQAEAFINDELKKQPHNIELQKILIETYMNTGQQQKAFAAVEKVLSALPVDDNRYVDFQNILAELNFRSGAVDKAKLIIKDILNKSQLNRDARFLLCRIFLQEGDALSAVGELRRLVSENPEIAKFSYYLGIAHEKRGEYVLAEKAFRSALDVTPDYKDALVKWITIYPKEGSLSEVENRIKKYLELHPDDNEIRQMQDSIHATKSNMLSHLIISAGSKT